MIVTKRRVVNLAGKYMSRNIKECYGKNVRLIPCFNLEANSNKMRTILISRARTNFAGDLANIMAALHIHRNQ